MTGTVGPWVCHLHICDTAPVRVTSRYSLYMLIGSVRLL